MDSASGRSLPPRSSSSRRTRRDSSRDMSSTSTAVTPRTDPGRARRFAPRPVQAPPPEGHSMTQHTHHTAPTQFVEANGIRFAYRRFGKPGSVPLVFNQHFAGTMDYWDPAVTDGLAKEREVILFNNAGVSSSSGDVPTSFQEIGKNAIAFIQTLRLAHGDVLCVCI